MIEALFHQDAKRVIKLYAIELSELFFEAQESVREGKVIFFCEPILGAAGCILRDISFIEVGKVYEFSQN